LGDVYRQLKDFDKAKNHLQKALQQNANNAFAHGRLGDIYRELGKLQDAQSHLQKAIELDSVDPFVLQSLKSLSEQSRIQDEVPLNKGRGNCFKDPQFYQSERDFMGIGRLDSDLDPLPNEMSVPRDFTLGNSESNSEIMGALSTPLNNASETQSNNDPWEGFLY